MSTVEIFMLVGLGMMFFMMIGVIYAAVKLSIIEDELTFMRVKLTVLVDNTRSIALDTSNIKYDVGDIRREVCAEDECECGSTEDDFDELIVIDDDEDELDIHLITPEEYYFADGFSKNELKYYPNADRVTYALGLFVMENVPEYLGDALVFFGMHVKEPNVVYVRNHVLNADFRIEKVEGKCDE